MRAIYMIALYAAQSSSQFFLNTFDFYSYTGYMLSGVLCAFSIIPIAITKNSVPDPTDPITKNVFHFFKISPFRFLGCIASGIIVSTFYSFTPNYAQEYNLSIPAIMSLTIAGGFILQWPIGYLSDIFDRRRILILLSFITVIPALIIMLFPFFSLSVLILSFLPGGLTFTMYLISIAQVCDRIQTEDITYASGALLLAHGIGCVVGPLIASLFIAYISTSSIYGFMAIIALALGLIGFITGFSRKSVPMDMQNYFIPLPNTSPTACEMDPRSIDKKKIKRITLDENGEEKPDIN